MAQWKKYENEFNPALCSDLLEYFNLLSEEQILKKLEFESTCIYVDEGLFIDEEQLQVLREEDKNITDRQSESAYYDDIDVLVVNHEFYSFAYHIGETIDDCKFLGDSLYTNYIHKIIKHFLDTGEHGFHLS